MGNPDVQRKVHEEIDRVIGSDRLPTLDDTKEKLPYFWATLKEVMRSQIVSPLMAPHFCSEDVTVGGHDGLPEYTLPKGTQLFLHGWFMGRDPDLWDHPDTFN